VIEDLGSYEVAVVQTAEEAIAEVERRSPDVVLMDIGLPDQSGLLAGRTMLARHENAKIVALTASTDHRLVDEALRLGFVGYLSKEIPLSRFMTAIQSVLDGHVVLPQRLLPIRRRTDADDRVAMLAEQLTSRERQVLALLVEGVDGQDAASALGISPHTFRTHVQSILNKLQVHSRLEAVAFAVRHGLVPAPTAGARLSTATGPASHRATHSS
jgi:DNA-binding NarL/FixJ family response regulator